MFGFIHVSDHVVRVNSIAIDSGDAVVPDESNVRFNDNLFLAATTVN